MKNKIFIFCFLLSILTLFTGCFSEKDSPLYDSEWLMTNFDSKNQTYYHHLILNKDHTVMLRVSYYDSTNIMVWKGTYKLNSKSIKFNFTDCIRFENGSAVGKYESKSLIKFYTGEYNYSVGLIGETEGKKEYHLDLIRPTGSPKNYFYGIEKDIFGNQLQDFVKIDKSTNTEDFLLNE